MDKQTTSEQPSLQRQEDYWDWWQASRSINPWALKRAECILSHVREASFPACRILDFGCGSGWFSEKLAAYGSVTGIDLSRKNMEIAQKTWPHIDFIGGDLFTFPLPSQSFDIAISQQVIAHVEDQRGYVQRIASLLKPGGVLVLTTNNRFVMRRLGTGSAGTHRHLGHLENWLSNRELAALLKDAFVTTTTTTILPQGDQGILRVVNSPKLNAALGRILGHERLKRTKEQLGLGYIRIVVARKT